MKLARFRHGGKERVGIVEEDRVKVLAECHDILDLIKQYPDPGQAPLSQRASGAGIPIAEVEFLAPLSTFRRDILCTGWNYDDHFLESVGKREGQEVPRPVAPTFFTKSPDTVIGPYDPIAFDERISRKWDYEGEIAVIIGRQGRSIPQARAGEYIWGYCLANDISQRDLQRRHGGQWLKGKTIDGTMPLGPWIVTADAFEPGEPWIKCWVNGELRQSAKTSEMVWSPSALLAELSFGMTVRPGDVLLTGTPSGIGNAMSPPRYLQDGDEITVEVPGLGRLRNKMQKADLHGASDVVL